MVNRKRLIFVFIFPLLMILNCELARKENSDILNMKYEIPHSEAEERFNPFHIHTLKKTYDKSESFNLSPYFDEKVDDNLVDFIQYTLNNNSLNPSNTPCYLIQPHIAIDEISKYTGSSYILRSSLLLDKYVVILTIESLIIFPIKLNDGVPILDIEGKRVVEELSTKDTYMIDTFISIEGIPVVLYLEQLTNNIKYFVIKMEGPLEIKTLIEVQSGNSQFKFGDMAKIGNFIFIPKLVEVNEDSLYFGVYYFDSSSFRSISNMNKEQKLALFKSGNDGIAEYNIDKIIVSYDNLLAEQEIWLFESNTQILYINSLTLNNISSEANYTIIPKLTVKFETPIIQIYSVTSSTFIGRRIIFSILYSYCYGK